MAADVFIDPQYAPIGSCFAMALFPVIFTQLLARIRFFAFVGRRLSV
jgi:hypothetical protein